LTLDTTPTGGAAHNPTNALRDRGVEARDVVGADHDEEDDEESACEDDQQEEKSDRHVG
jgi:hypothetical protein